jgi:hypothetical protein
MAATQRPVAALAFTEPNGAPAWKNLPSWAVVATGDKAAGSDMVRSMAERGALTSEGGRAAALQAGEILALAGLEQTPKLIVAEDGNRLFWG